MFCGRQAVVRRPAPGEGDERGRGSQPLLALAGLLLHVRDRDAVDAAHRDGPGEGGAGVVRVQVHAAHRRLADHEQAIPHRDELALEPVAVDAVALEQERGAVPVLGLLLVHRLEAERPLDRLERRVDVLAPGSGDRSAAELHQAGRARVDDPRLAQHREHRLGAHDALGRDGEHLVDDRVEVASRALLGGLRHLADHGQHRALDRQLHGPVGGVGGRPQRPRERVRVEHRRRPDDVDEAAHDLGQDRAAVAARPHQHRALGGRGDGDHPVGADLLEAGRELPRRLGQVRAGVAVRHRIDVQVVQVAAAGLDGRGRPAGCGERDPMGIAHAVRFTPWMWICSEDTWSSVSFSTWYFTRERRLAATSARFSPNSTTT